MPGPDITYRTAGTWGAGKGSDLTPAEVDNNFKAIVDAFAALDIPAGVGIESITSDGSTFTVHMTDASSQGPFNLPVASLRFRGDWAPATDYIKFDFVLDAGTGLYLVNLAHTSDADFDPARQIGGVDVYRLVLPVTGGGGGGTLAGLTDVEFGSDAPAEGDMLRYRGGKWVDEAPTISIPFFWRGILTDDCVLLEFAPAEDFALPAALPGSTGVCRTNPASSAATISLQKNGVEFGTLTFDGAGDPTYTAAAPAAFVGGADILTIKGQASADAAFADVFGTLFGTRP